MVLDKTWGYQSGAPSPECCATDTPGLDPDSFLLNLGTYLGFTVTAINQCTGLPEDISGDMTSWWSGNPAIAQVVKGKVTGVAPGYTTANASGEVIECAGNREYFQEVYPAAPVTVLTATVSLNSSGQVSATDGASTLYKGLVGSLNLGTMAGQLGVNNACFGGNELVGTVQPSTSVGPVTVKRTLTSGGCWVGSTVVACPIANGADDTGTLIETNPQNVTPGGSANGHVYNLDNPGVIDPLATTPNRVRYNFTAYAVGPDGATKISPDLSYYVVLSCIKNSSGVAQLSIGVSGDNQIGLGTTKTSWNLQ